MPRKVDPLKDDIVSALLMHASDVAHRYPGGEAHRVDALSTMLRIPGEPGQGPRYFLVKVTEKI